jgi:HTH-type transcriptional regulator / antitoxin HigA
MAELKYIPIKTKKQYYNYCDVLEILIEEDNKEFENEIELLTILIDKWDKEHDAMLELDPIQLLKSLMVNHGLKQKDLVVMLGLSKGTVSKMLSYHKGLSKETIRILAKQFKMNQEAFNRSYQLVSTDNRKYPNAKVMNTEKIMAGVE